MPSAATTSAEQRFFDLDVEAASHVFGLNFTGTFRKRATIFEGYRQALQAAGIAYDPLLTRSGTFRKESAQHFAQELLAITPAIDALFVGNNLMAMGALDAIHAQNLRVPEDIAFVGYDELPWVAPGFGSLTTVAQPVYELGSTAALRLFQRLQKTAPQASRIVMTTHEHAEVYSSAWRVSPRLEQLDSLTISSGWYTRCLCW